MVCFIMVAHRLNFYIEIPTQSVTLLDYIYSIRLVQYRIYIHIYIYNL